MIPTIDDAHRGHRGDRGQAGEFRQQWASRRLSGAVRAGVVHWLQDRRFRAGGTPLPVVAADGCGMTELGTVDLISIDVRMSASDLREHRGLEQHSMKSRSRK